MQVSEHLLCIGTGTGRPSTDALAHLADARVTHWLVAGAGAAAIARIGEGAERLQRESSRPGSRQEWSHQPLVTGPQRQGGRCLKSHAANEVPSPPPAALPLPNCYLASASITPRTCWAHARATALAPHRAHWLQAAERVVNLWSYRLCDQQCSLHACLTGAALFSSSLPLGILHTTLPTSCPGPCTHLACAGIAGWGAGRADAIVRAAAAARPSHRAHQLRGWHPGRHHISAQADLWCAGSQGN